MATSNTAALMIRQIENALATNAGVVSISIDGTTVSYNRQQALEELQYWKQQEAKANGRKPRISSINLGGAW